MTGLRLEVLALANYADFSKDGKFNILGIFDEIYSSKFPASFVRGFVALVIAGATPNKDLSLDIEITDDDGKKIIENPPINLKVGNNGKANFNIELVGMPLPKAGEYVISVKSGKILLGKTIFKVIKVADNARQFGKVGHTVN